MLFLDNIYLYVARYVKDDMTVDKFLFDADAKTLTHIRRILQQPEFHMQVFSIWLNN